MKTLIATMIVIMMSLASTWVMANSHGGGGTVPAMPIYRCVIDQDGKITEEWVPHHICQLKGGKTMF